MATQATPEVVEVVAPTPVAQSAPAVDHQQVPSAEDSFNIDQK